MMTAEKVSNRLGEILKEEGRSMYWLEKRVSFTMPTIRKWRDNDKQPTLDQLAELASVLNRRVEDFIA